MYLEIQNPEVYRAALYIRLSKEDENEGPSESVSNQKSMLEDFAFQHQLTVYGVYIDDGWSGGNFERPNFQRMLFDIEKKQVNMVITKDLSRLGRDYILTGHYMERYFPEHQVRYISLLDGIDTGVESTANDITPFRAIMNDMYAKDISKKISSVKHDKQRKGLFIGGKPAYGYKMHPTEKNKIVIDEGAAPVVRRIFGMALEGISARQIAVRLNAESVPPPAVYAGLKQGRCGPYTGLWSSERISYILQNETYIGSMVQGRSRKISYKSKKCVRQNRDDWIVVEGMHEPLIDRELFDQVQRLLCSRSHTRSRTYDFLLKGIIFCHECGHPLAVINRKNAKGEDCLYFVCRTYQRFTKAGVCTSHTIKEETVTRAVLGKVREICKPYWKAAELLPMAQREIEKTFTAAECRTAIEDRKARVENLTAQLDKVYLDRLSGILDEKDFQRIYAKIKSERGVLEQQLRRQEPLKELPVRQTELAQTLTERFLENGLTNREFLVSLIERVELTSQGQVILRFRFQEPEDV